MSNGISSRSASASEVSTGILLMFLSVLVSPIIDIFSKLAIATIPAAEITAARFVVQAQRRVLPALH